MPGFDAELHLRLLGERALLDRGAQHEASPLRAAADALLAIGAADRAVVDEVLADYRLASRLREGEAAFFEDGFEPGAPATEPLPARRVVPCDVELELAIGTLRARYVSFSERSTTLDALLRFDGAVRRRGLITAGFHSGPPSLTLTDDRGTAAPAHFSGGGGETYWEGRFMTLGPLAQDTRFIEVDGQRVDLVAGAVRTESWIEPLPDAGSAIGYLWRVVAPHDDFFSGVRHETVIETLVAAGALAPDDPALAEVRAVATAVQEGAMHGGPVPRGLPEPWKTVLRPGRGRGPEGMLVVGAATPVFDGTAVGVAALESEKASWRIDVDVAPASAMFGSAAGRLAWWAIDDRGGHYLGQMGNWGTEQDEIGRGEVHFRPVLDKRATSVDIHPTGRTQRAVIRIPLEWP